MNVLPMAYAIIYLCVGGMILIASWLPQSLLLTVILVNAALASITIGVAYGLRKSKLTMKGEIGSFSFFSYLLFWPLLVANHLALSIYRLVGKENLMDEIVPGLYLGSKPLLVDKNKLEKHGIRTVLDLTAEFHAARFIRKNFIYRCLPILDNLPPSLQQIQQVVPWIQANLKQGGVLIHCAYGHSRSATLLIAYLLRAHGPADGHRVLDLIAAIRLKRPRVKLRSEQLAVLRMYATETAT